MNISWVGGNCTGDARIGWVIDSDEYPRVIANKEVRFDTNGHSSLQLDNCLITSNKKITGEITIQNSVINTDFFADDYNWVNFHTNGNTSQMFSINLFFINDATDFKNAQHRLMFIIFSHG